MNVCKEKMLNVKILSFNVHSMAFTCECMKTVYFFTWVDKRDWYSKLYFFFVFIITF